MKQVKLFLSIYINVHAILGFVVHPHVCNIDGISAISVCVNETINKSNFQSQYLGKTKRRIKTLHVDSEMVSWYTSLFVKRNFNCFSFDWGNAMQFDNSIFTGTGNE